MSFEMTVVSNTPLSSVDDLETVAVTFLTQVGYLPKGYDPKTGTSEVTESVPYRLFVDCFLKRMDKAWLVEDLATELETSKPTVYRHVNKLKSMDLLEDVQVDIGGGQMKKGYRIRYGDLSKAWNFVEAHVQVALENYRKSVVHLQDLAREDD